MRINRMLEILLLLLNREMTTAKELAERFEVSTRTIYRDIDSLSAAGVPINTNRGNGGGITLQNDYTLKKTMLSRSESESLLSAIKTIGAASYPETDAIINKLGSIFKSTISRDWVEVDFEGWEAKANEQNRFSKIRDAIINNQVISFDYINGKGIKSSRSVEPYKLLFNVYTWYLIAFCLEKNSTRMFRLSRIKNVQVTMQHFSERSIDECPEQGSYAPFVELKLRCNDKVLNRLYDTFDEEYITLNRDGSCDVSVSLPEEEWVYGYILSLGSNAEVLQPEHIREIIKSRAKEITKKYQ